MLTNHLDLNLPNQPRSKPKPALQASAFSAYFLLEAMLHLILCSCCLDLHSVSLFSMSSRQSLPVSLRLFDVLDYTCVGFFFLRIWLPQRDKFQLQIFVQLLSFITVSLALNVVCRQHRGFTFQFLRELVFRAELHEACSSNCVMWTQYDVQRWSHLLTVLMYSYEKSF